MRHLFGRWMLLLPAAAAAPAAPLSAEQQQAAAKQRPVQIWAVERGRRESVKGGPLPSSPRRRRCWRRGASGRRGRGGVEQQSATIGGRESPSGTAGARSRRGELPRPAGVMSRAVLLGPAASGGEVPGRCTPPLEAAGLLGGHSAWSTGESKKGDWARAAAEAGCPAAAPALPLRAASAARSARHLAVSRARSAKTKSTEWVLKGSWVSCLATTSGGDRFLWTATPSSRMASASCGRPRYLGSGQPRCLGLGPGRPPTHPPRLFRPARPRQSHLPDLGRTVQPRARAASAAPLGLRPPLASVGGEGGGAVRRSQIQGVLWPPPATVPRRPPPAGVPRSRAVLPLALGR
ncbi:hypothetical protein SETIT_5G226200v2 [Setaria italica]|uniref:Uncharacterized protein n=1 Tax=Setaria italica TaxID=4555 RepID=A0A368R7L9_SETIT|nr:hypothetical protein SETIT_5G226200v2 [Setaria italica]